MTGVKFCSAFSMQGSTVRVPNSQRLELSVFNDVEREQRDNEITRGQVRKINPVKYSGEVGFTLHILVEDRAQED